jgi:hypothetical protein
MASLPIPFDESQPEKEKAQSRRRLQLVPRPHDCVSVSVRLGNHVAEIIVLQHPHPRKTCYCYAILTLAGEKIYQSGKGFLSISSVVEKAAQHLETLWNAEGPPHFPSKPSRKSKK